VREVWVDFVVVFVFVMPGGKGHNPHRDLEGNMVYYLLKM